MTLPTQHDICITKEESIGVLGYLNNYLIGIQNISGYPIECTGFFDVKNRSTKIRLQHEEVLRMHVDITECIRNKFMPYIRTEQDISIRSLWNETG